MASRTRQFPLVQALRALAALSVAFTHVVHDALTLWPHSHALAWVYTAMPWGAGVDVFFVISGFVIVHSSQNLYGTPQAGRRFAARRLARIVPLYWLMTSLFLAEWFLNPASINGDIGGLGYIVKSYLFIPAARPDGLVQPALGLGWTLNYEMFFYVLFLPFLALRQSAAAIGATTVLVLLAALGQAGRLHGVILLTWSDPVILEFGAGMLLALLPGRVCLPGLARLALAAAALVFLHWQPAGWPRALASGVPAAMLAAAAITGPDKPGQTLPERMLVVLGDASYALYLAHPFVMRAAALGLAHLHGFGGQVLYILVCLAAAQLAALALHRFFEMPCTAWLRARLEALPFMPARHAAPP